MSAVGEGDVGGAFGEGEEEWGCEDEGGEELYS